MVEGRGFIYKHAGINDAYTVNKDPEQRLDIFRRLLHDTLPSENYNTLKYLIRHLVRYRVVDDEDDDG